MSNLSIQVVKDGNVKTVELESLAHPNDPFTIILLIGVCVFGCILKESQINLTLFYHIRR